MRHGGSKLMKSAHRLLVPVTLLAVSVASRVWSQRTQPELKLVYQNNDFQLTGISVSKQGRVFVNFPRWSPEYQNAVMEVMPDGSAKPFPNDEWNRWDLTPQTASRHFVCVQSIVVDENDALWVLDPAAPMLMSIIPGGPKLVKVDLKTNQVARVIPVGPDVAKTSSYLNDVRFDKRNFAYITDSGLGGIIVVDLSSGKSHRALDGDPSVMPDKSVKIVIDGKPVLGPTGQTPPFHSDAIALSPDGQYLYYQAIASNTLYRVKTDALRDPNGKPVPEKYAKTFPVDGIWADTKGNIYLSNLQAKSVSRLTPDRRIQTVVTDNRLEWPDTFSEGPNGSIFITASHINQSPTYNSGKSARTGPYQVFKFKP
jgi:sugar lactone lactonase YvrE